MTYADVTPPLFDEHTASAELSLALEELTVADEELRQQNEELVAAQQVVERQRERYEHLFNFAPDPYLITDRASVIREANQAASALFGVETRFLIGKPLIAFVATDERRQFRTLLDQIGRVRASDEWDITLQPRHVDAIVVSALTAVSEPWTGRSGQLRWILRDVTERRALEAEVAQQKAELAREVEIRTAQLTTALREKEELLNQARLAQSTLEVANRLTTDFLAVLSHEIRTPLQAIGGYSEILVADIHGPLNDQQRQDIGRIRRSQEHLLSLVNTILDFSKLKSGQVMVPELHPVAVDEMLRGIFPLIEPQIEAKQLRCDYESAPPTLVALADRDRTQQIVLNLLANAVKFTGVGGTITIGAFRDGSSVVITVSDTGIGISPEKIDLIFEPFVQVSGSRATGTGLGLAISRHLAEAMGGSLSAESALGKGSTFTLRLPADLRSHERAS